MENQFFGADRYGAQLGFMGPARLTFCFCAIELFKRIFASQVLPQIGVATRLAIGRTREILS